MHSVVNFYYFILVSFCTVQKKKKKQIRNNTSNLFDHAFPTYYSFHNRPHRDNDLFPTTDYDFLKNDNIKRRDVFTQCMCNKKPGIDGLIDNNLH